MTARLFAGLLPVLFATAAIGQTVFVDEDFESYGSQGAFTSAWVARGGDGFSPAPGPSGLLVAEVDGVEGQTGFAATGAQGLINEDVNGWDPIANPSGYQIVPSATESIVMRGDIFIDAETGTTHRQTLGLRSDRFDRDPTSGVAFGLNFVELGTWNGSVCLPTAPDCFLGDNEVDPPLPPDENARIENDFAYRLAIFDSTTQGNLFENGVDLGPLQVEPNWQYFPLKEELDLDTTVLPNGSAGNGDGAVDLGDIGSGWHTFEATISETAVTLTLDLFRDGIDNSTGLSGVDSEVVVEIAMAANENDPPFFFDPSPMNSFRFGSPSGVSSDPGVASFDNLYLALEEVTEEGLVGDYDGNGVVDAADYTIYRDTLGDSVTAGEGADGNGNGVIDPGDRDVWAGNYGATAAVATAVPGADRRRAGHLGCRFPRRPSSLTLCAAARFAVLPSGSITSQGTGE